MFSEELLTKANDGVYDRFIDEYLERPLFSYIAKSEHVDLREFLNRTAREKARRHSLGQGPAFDIGAVIILPTG